MKTFLIMLVMWLVSVTAYAANSETKKQIDFEGDVVEGVNRQPLYSLNQVSEADG